MSIEPSSMIKFVWQNQVEEAPSTIDMIMPIHIEEKKVILKEDLIAKIKLISVNVKQELAKNLKDFHYSTLIFFLSLEKKKVIWGFKKYGVIEDSQVLTK